MRAFNRVLVSGEVRGRPLFGTTSKGASCCSFLLYCNREHRGTFVFVKVNVYEEGFVEVCRERLYPGGYVFIDGELMNRQVGEENLTEIRAFELLFYKHPPRG